VRGKIIGGDQFSAVEIRFKGDKNRQNPLLLMKKAVKHPMEDGRFARAPQASKGNAITARQWDAVGPIPEKI